MRIATTQALVSLGQFAAAVAKTLDHDQNNVFPVLGAEGDNFYIQICSGEDFVGRKVLKIIHVEFDPLEANIGSAEPIEVMVTLPDASHLVALLSLLQIALSTKRVMIHHPLDGYGDHLLMWDRSMLAASPCMPS